MPKGVFAVLVLGVIFAFILLNDPPRTVCDGQMDVFREAQKRFLFKDESTKAQRKPKIEELTETCRFQASPGGCLELFDRLRKFAVDLTELGSRCEAGAGKAPEIQSATWVGLDLLTRLAWGERGPRSYVQRTGWLDSGEVALFCRLKGKALAFYGAPALLAFRERTLGDLPASSGLSHEQVIERSLFSIPCEAIRSTL